MTRLIKLEVSNVKRIKWASIDTSGNLLTVAGLNAQGKSSLLDAIQMLYGPGRLVPSDPIHHGATGKSYIRGVEDNGVTTELRFTASGATKKVMDPKQGTLPSPQKVCDDKAPAIAFDPLAFSRMRPSEQLEVLKQLGKLDFTALDDEYAQVFEERTNINREIKSLQSRVAAAPRPVNPPKAEVSVAELAKELQQLQAENTKRAETRRLIQVAHDAVRAVNLQFSGVEVAKLDLDVDEADLDELLTAEIEKQIATAEEDNRKYREAKALADLEADLDCQSENERTCSARLEEIKAEKDALVASAKLPLPGLALTDTGVTYNGVPLEQCSSAELTNVSAAIGFSLVPPDDQSKLRIMLVREGSLLDKNSLKKLAEMADKYGWTCLIEVVGEDGDIVVSDGTVTQK